MQDAHLAETQQSLGSIRPEHQERQRQDQQFEGENFDYYADRKTGRRYCRVPRRNLQAASSSSTSQWPTSQWQTSWNSWQPTSSEKWWWFRFREKNSRKSMGGGQYTDQHCPYSAVQSVHHKRGTHRTRLAQELRNIDQCWEDVNSERNIGAKILNSTAPSSSRSTEESCRSNLFIFFWHFETSLVAMAWFYVNPITLVVT